MFKQGIALGEGKYQVVDEIIDEIGLAKARGDRAEMRRLLATSPGALRDSKEMQRLAIWALEPGDVAERARLFERFQRSFPGDLASDMIAIEVALLRKDVAGALAAIDHLDQRVAEIRFSRPRVRMRSSSIRAPEVRGDRLLSGVRGLVDQAPEVVPVVMRLAATSDQCGQPSIAGTRGVTGWAARRHTSA